MSMGVMEPTLAQLTATNERAAVTLSRLKTLPFDEKWEMSKQTAITKVEKQMATADQMLLALVQVNGALHHALYRNFTELEDHYMGRQLDEPALNTTEAADGFLNMMDQGGSPMWGPHDPLT